MFHISMRTAVQSVLLAILLVLLVFAALDSTLAAPATGPALTDDFQTCDQPVRHTAVELLSGPDVDQWGIVLEARSNAQGDPIFIILVPGGSQLIVDACTDWAYLPGGDGAVTAQNR